MTLLETLAAATGLPLSDVREMDGKTIGWRSMYRPELGLLGSEDVFECERCDGRGEISGSYGGDGYGDRCCGVVDWEAECPDCRGTGFVHGYDSNLRAMPAVMEVGR